LNFEFSLFYIYNYIQNEKIYEIHITIH
jgi:hypothetical protein